MKLFITENPLTFEIAIINSDKNFFNYPKINNAFSIYKSDKNIYGSKRKCEQYSRKRSREN